MMLLKLFTSLKIKNYNVIEKEDNINADTVE